MPLDLGFLILLAIVSAGLGYRVLGWLHATPEYPVDAWALAVPLGLGILALAVLGLAELGILTPVAMASFLGIGLLVGGKGGLVGTFAARPRVLDRRPSSLVFDLLLGLTLLGTLLTSLAPVTDGDALCYHLQVPKVFLASRSAVFDPDLHETIYPLVTESLYAVGLGLRGPVACRLIQWLLGLTFAANVAAIARPILGDRARWAGTIALLVPAVSNGMGAPLNDVALAAFGNAAIHAWIRWRDCPSWRAAVLTGLLLGIAIGVKYPALVLGGLLGIGFVLGRWRLVFFQRRSANSLSASGLTPRHFSFEPRRSETPLTPSPLVGEGWGGGCRTSSDGRNRLFSGPNGSATRPPTSTLPHKGGGSRNGPSGQTNPAIGDSAGSSAPFEREDHRTSGEPEASLLSGPLAMRHTSPPAPLPGGEGRQTNLKTTLAHAFIFGLVALLVGGGWYLRAYIHTGNPVYPFFRQVFGGSGIDEVLDPIKRPMAVSAWNLLTSLAPLTLQPDRFDSFSHQFGPMFLLFLPALLWMRPPRRVVGIVALGYAFLILCLTQRQSMRFLLIAIGPLSVGVAWLVSTWWDRRTIPGRLLVGFLLAAMTFEASLAVARTRHGLRVVTGRESADSFLARREPTFVVGRWIAANLPTDARIVGQDHRGFYLPRSYAMELAHRRRTGLGKRGESASEVVEALRQSGFTHVLLCPPVPENAVEFDPTLGRLLAPWLANVRPLYRKDLGDADGVVRRYAIYALDQTVEEARR